MLFRSYRSIGDETFIRAFETATLGYEEWTHEVFSYLTYQLHDSFATSLFLLHFFPMFLFTPTSLPHPPSLSI